MQGSYYFSDFTDNVSGTLMAPRLQHELKVKNLGM